MANTIRSSCLRIFCLIFAIAITGATQASASEFTPADRGKAPATNTVRLPGSAGQPASGLAQQELQFAHCCHAHPYAPYDNYCCHPQSTTVYVAPRPVYGVGPASVRGVSRRTSRRVSRRR